MEDGTRACPYCGGALQPRRTKHCGAESCSKKHAAAVARAWYRRKVSGAESLVLACQRDGCCKPVSRRKSANGVLPSYCSEWCQKVAAADRRQARSIASRASRSPRLCGYCSERIPDEAPTYRKFCDTKCGERYRKGIKVPKGRTCGECGKPIPDEAHPQRKFCDLYCKGRAQYKVHAPKLRRRAAEWRERNPDYVTTWQAAYRERHREILRVIHRAEYKADPLPWKNARDRRRALLRDDPRTRRVTARDWSRLVNRYGGRCAYCGEKRELTLEHVVPLSRGGRHAIGNIIPACMSCNASKNSRFIMEWRLGRPAFRRSRKREAECPEPPSTADAPAA